jgi:hypothetical protein
VIYTIRHQYCSAFVDEPRIIGVTLTTKHRTDGEPNLSVNYDKTAHRFAKKSAETRAANKLRRLVESIDLRIPSNWRDESETCDGWTNELTIECGYNKLQFHWFCDCPPEWVAVADLAGAIRAIAASKYLS